MEPDSLKKALERSLLTGNWDVLDAWTTKECSFTFNYGSEEKDERFDDSVLEVILNALSNEAFLRAEGSHHLLRVLEFDWSLLTRSQRSRLLPKLGVAFPALMDPLSWFIIAELLGRNYADDAALQLILELNTINNDKARALLPMALDQMVQTAGPSLAISAHAELLKMRSDPSEEVRAEVETSLARLSAQKAMRS